MICEKLFADCRLNLGEGGGVVGVMVAWEPGQSHLCLPGTVHANFTSTARVDCLSSSRASDVYLLIL